MSKTVLNIDRGFKLVDSNSKVYETTVDILKRLKELRVGTVVNVNNNYNKLNCDIDPMKTYYLTFDKFGVVMLIYVNVKNRVHKVIARTTMDDIGRDIMQYDATVQFISKLHEIYGTLRVLNFDDGNKRGYALGKVEGRSWLIDSHGRYTVMAWTPIQIPYRNLDGKLLKQNWISLEEAVIQYALRVPKDNREEHIAVLTEYNTVVFML